MVNLDASSSSFELPSQNFIYTSARNKAQDALDLVSSGGVGDGSQSPPPTPSYPRDPSEAAPYSHHGHKSLAGIATRSLILGGTLSSSLCLVLYLVNIQSPLWRAPLFVASLSIFHFLEFWTTAAYNTPAVSISSFLFTSNGSAYYIANIAALLECLITNIFFSTRQWLPPFLSTTLTIIGLFLVPAAQTVRSLAMITAGQSFNHVVQHRRASTHKLVTDGIYGWSRHPSYFGYFWWGLGTQLMVGNPVCFVGYAVVLWMFFHARIRREEQFLVEFFGEEYVQFRKRTGVGIPFL